LRLGQEQRLQLHPRRQREKKSEKRLKAASGAPVAWAASSSGRQPGEELPASLGAGRGIWPWCQLRMVCETWAGLEKPMRQRRQGLRVVLDAGEDQAAELRRQLLLVGEELAVAALTVFRVRSMAASNLRSRAKPARAATRFRSVSVLRQLVGLFVGQHLDPVLDGAQRS
jgi:hypothetical protein